MQKQDSSDINILLVGEYGLRVGGSALTIPAHHINSRVRAMALEQQKEHEFFNSLNGHATPLYPDSKGNRLKFKPSSIPGDYLFFILDSEETFEHEDPLTWFQQEMKNSGFASSIRNEYLVIAQKLIAVLLGERDADPAMLFRALSDFQFTHFREMIPVSIIDTWIEGQISNEYYLKLLGPGGRLVMGIAHESSRESLEERWTEKITWII